MNSLFSLYSATGLTDVTQTADYQAGNAAGWLARNEKQAATNHPLSGRLCLSKSGWLLLSVPNALVRGVFDALTAPGIELPTTGTMNVPNVAGDILNAHISVMTAEEVAKIGPAKINERGHSFGYTLGPVHEIAVKNVDGVSKVWAIQVSAPGLSALRKSYGLSPLPKDQPFHITVAVRRTNVLGNNDVSKFDAAAGRGELKAAAEAPRATNKKAAAEKTAVETKLINFEPVLRGWLRDYADMEYFHGKADTERGLHLLHAFRDKAQRPVATVGLRHLFNLNHAVNDAPRSVFEVVDFHTALEHRKKGYGRLLWDQLKSVHPHSVFVTHPEGYKDKQLTDEELTTVYKKLGFLPTHPELNLPPNFYALDPSATGSLKATKAATDRLLGGEADNIPDNKFSKSKLQEGAKHEHEHTSNDQVAKEIAKDHLSEDPQYYKKQELVENAQPQVLKDLLQAKEHSDARRYAHKAAILRRLMTQAPQDWIVDQPNMLYRGITHRPTGFKFHTHPASIPGGVKTANSVYLNQLRNSFLSRGGIQYDHTKPVFENIRNHMFRVKNQGDWILQTQRNHQLYRSALDPAYRHQLALQAFHGTMPQPHYIDQIIERYGGGIIGGK